GRTEVSSRASTMPDTSTLLLKQYLAAFSTVTAGPRGVPSPSSPAASAGCAVSSAAVSSANSFGGRSRVMQLIIGNPMGFPASSIAERGLSAKHRPPPVRVSRIGILPQRSVRRRSDCLRRHPEQLGRCPAENVGLFIIAQRGGGKDVVH